MGYSYDRRSVVADAAAAKRPPPKMRPVPHNDKADALKDLERTLGHLDMWAGRARMALDPAHNTEGFPSQFKSTPKELAELTKLRDELKAFVEKVRHLEAE